MMFNFCERIIIKKVLVQSILGFIILLPTLMYAQAGKIKKPVSIIFDTDMGPDYDDIGAIAILHAMADSGECKILATIASNKNKRIGAVLNVMNTYFNKPNLSVGVIKGNAVNMEAPQKWDSLIVAKYPHRIKNNKQAGDALKLYRKILSKQPDKSVTIVTVGFLSNMANLLQSPPDKFSPLSGKVLITKKVKQLVCMAGKFDSDFGSFKEFNIVKDSLSSKITFDNWPTHILFSGFEIGAKIHTGLKVANSNLINSPVKDVFALSIPLDQNDVKGRMSWDETAVLVAVRGYEKYFDVVKGKIICNIDGSNGWNKKGKRDFYLVQKIPVSEMENIINDLILHQPAGNY